MVSSVIRGKESVTLLLLGTQLCTIYRLQLLKGDEKHLIGLLRQLPVAGHVVEPVAVYEMTLGEKLQKV